MKSRRCPQLTLYVAAMQMPKRERRTQERNVRQLSPSAVKTSNFHSSLQSEERMVGSNPKSSKEPFGCKKCPGNLKALQKIPFPHHQK